MKIRIGFVSNSSSSSFLLYGTHVDKFEPYDDDRYTADELKKAGLSFRSPCYDDGYYIGASWSSVGDDETGKQFKERVEKKLKEILGDDIKCSTYEEAWYDG